MKVSTKQDWVFYVLNVIIILLKKVDEPSIKCSVCGRTIFSGDFYASGEDNETFCLHCLNDRSDKATNTNEDKINRPVHLKKVIGQRTFCQKLCMYFPWCQLYYIQFSV